MDTCATKGVITIDFGAEFTEEEAIHEIREMFSDRFADEMWVDEVYIKMGTL